MQNTHPLFARLLATIVFIALPFSANSDARNDYTAALQDWQQVLVDYVDDQGRTDFVALAKEPGPLLSFVQATGAHGPNSDADGFESREATLAYHINTYNALAMHGVIDEGIPADFSSFFKRAGFFRFRKVTIDGTDTNLYDYENKVIRPLNDARIHFALNCMVQDCPRLPRTVFTPIDLDTQLEQAAREFINSDKYVQVDDEQRLILVSAIFDFYTKDFVPSGKARDLPDYINLYRAEPLPEGYKVRYMEYDWTINQQPSD